MVAQIDPEILLIEARRSASRPPVDATAYDFMLRAVPLIGRMDRAHFMQAGEYLAKAIALEPDYAAALCLVCLLARLPGRPGLGGRPAGEHRAGGPDSPSGRSCSTRSTRAALAIAGHVRAFLHRRPREAAALHERALSLNPNLAMAWALSAVTHAYLGDADEAERRNNRYKRLSPLDPHAFLFDGFSVLIHLLKRDHESAVGDGTRGQRDEPVVLGRTSNPTWRRWAISAAPRKRRAVRRRLLAIEPDFTDRAFPGGHAAGTRERSRALRRRPAAGRCP